MKVVICVYHAFELWRPPEWFPERLRHDFPQLEVVHLPTYDGLDEQVVEAEVLVNWNLRPEQFRCARKLRWIHSTAAAVHTLMFPELIASDVLVTNARNVHGPVVAEHALALVLACAKRLPSAARFQAQRVWGQEQIWRDPVRPREIAGATLGILGFGAIGQSLAELAAPLGMRVLALREHPENTPRNSGVEILGPSGLARLLGESDFVALAAPVTPKTRHLINAERLAQMKPSAYLVNVSRGALVDEAALIEALNARRIAGAALDVAETEPLPSDSPLWCTENLFLTPHTAGFTDRLWERNYAIFADNLRRYLGGEPLLHQVDKAKGY